ncbi:hypothetical protein VTO58DRAFT_105242 [Aureobasidium pullulans]
MPRSRTFLLGRPSPCSITTVHTLSPSTPAIMISDDQLYQLAIFLGSVSMLLIVLYHFLEVNAENDDKATPLSAERKADTVPGAKPVRS